MPQELVAALEAHDQLRTQTAPTPTRFDIETVGAQLAATVLNGEPAEVYALACEVYAAEVDHDVARIANQVQAEAVERLARRAVAAMRDNSDIVFASLSSAFDETLDAARAAVKAMEGIDIVREAAMRARKTDEYLTPTRSRPPLAGHLRRTREGHASDRGAARARH